MSGGFEVDADRLRATAAELKAVADGFTSAVRSFETEVAGFGAPWGGDDIGMLIGLAHDAVFQAALESFSSNAEELAGRAEAITSVAENYTQMEDANTLYVNKIGDLL